MQYLFKFCIHQREVNELLSHDLFKNAVEHSIGYEKTHTPVGKYTNPEQFIDYR